MSRTPLASLQFTSTYQNNMDCKTDGTVDKELQVVSFITITILATYWFGIPTIVQFCDSLVMHYKTEL